MKNTVCILILMASISALAAPPSPQSQVKFTEAEYQLKVGSDPKCPEDIIRLEYAGDDQNRVLRLGEKITFTHLEKNSFQEDGTKDCKYITQNQAEETKLTQVTTLKCKKKSDSFEKTQELASINGELTYSYKYTGAKSSAFKCLYARGGK